MCSSLKLLILHTCYEGYQGHFKWNEYLNDPNINPAPAHIFTAVSSYHYVINTYNEYNT